MPATFLLLEITDPEVNALLWRMREIVSGRRHRTAIHLTLRGPYTTEPDQEILDRARIQMAGDVLRIHGAGRFSNPDGEVVFVRVDSPRLREVWWKPTYRGFEPHISIYRGTDRRLAELLERFLIDVKIEILCAEYRLVWHQSEQRNFFDANEPTIGAMESFVQNGRLNPDLLDRLSDVMDTYLRTFKHA